MGTIAAGVQAAIDFAGATLSSVWSGAKTLIKGLSTGISEKVGMASELISQIADWFDFSPSAIVDKVMDYASELLSGWSAILSTLVSSVVSVANYLIKTATTALSWVVNAGVALAQKMGTNNVDKMGKILSIGEKIAELFGLQSRRLTQLNSLDPLREGWLENGSNDLPIDDPSDYDEPQTSLDPAPSGKSLLTSRDFPVGNNMSTDGQPEEFPSDTRRLLTPRRLADSTITNAISTIAGVIGTALGGLTKGVYYAADTFCTYGLPALARFAKFLLGVGESAGKVVANVAEIMVNFFSTNGPIVMEWVVWGLGQLVDSISTNFVSFMGWAIPAAHTAVIGLTKSGTTAMTLMGTAFVSLGSWVWTTGLPHMTSLAMNIMDAIRLSAAAIWTAGTGVLSTLRPHIASLGSTLASAAVTISDNFVAFVGAAIPAAVMMATYLFSVATDQAAALAYLVEAFGSQLSVTGPVVLDFIMRAVSNLVTAGSTAFTDLMNMVLPLACTIASTLANDVIPTALSYIGTGITTFASHASSIAGWLLNDGAELAMQGMAAFASAANSLFTAGSTLFSSLSSIIIPMCRTLAELARDAANNAYTNIAAFANAALPAAKDMAGYIFSAVTEQAANLAWLIHMWGDVFKETAPVIMEWVMTGISWLASNAATAFTDTMGWALPLAKDIAKSLANDVLPTALGYMSSGIAAFATYAKSAVGWLMDDGVKLVSGGMAALATAADLLFDAGSTLFSELSSVILPACNTLATLARDAAGNAFTTLVAFSEAAIPYAVTMAGHIFSSVTEKAITVASFVAEFANVFASTAFERLQTIWWAVSLLANDALSQFTTLVGWALPAIITFARGWASEVQAASVVAFEYLGTGLANFASGITNNAVPLATACFEGLTTVATTFWGGAQDTLAALLPVMRNVASGFATLVHTVTGTAYSGFVAFATDALPHVNSLVSAALSAIGDKAELAAEILYEFGKVFTTSSSLMVEWALRAAAHLSSAMVDKLKDAIPAAIKIAKHIGGTLTVMGGYVADGVVAMMNVLGKSLLESTNYAQKFGEAMVTGFTVVGQALQDQLPEIKVIAQKVGSAAATIAYGVSSTFTSHLGAAIPAAIQMASALGTSAASKAMNAAWVICEFAKAFGGGSGGVSDKQVVEHSFQAAADSAKSSSRRLTGSFNSQCAVAVPAAYDVAKSLSNVKSVQAQYIADAVTAHAQREGQTVHAATIAAYAPADFQSALLGALDTSSSSCASFTSVSTCPTSRCMWTSGSCAVKCTVPSVQGATVSGCTKGGTVSNGATCTWTAETDYSCTNLGAHTCTDGAAFPVPVCMRKCMVPSVAGASTADCPQGGTVNSGTTCTWTALTGQTCQNIGTITCTNGQFSDTPSCVDSPCVVPHVTGASSTCTAGTTVNSGTSCTWTADTGKTCQNVGAITCKGGQFSATPNCGETPVTHCNVPEVTGATSACTAGTSVADGTVCSWSPKAGFTCTNTAAQTCSGGQFSTVPTCQQAGCKPFVLQKDSDAGCKECSTWPCTWTECSKSEVPIC